ncbi:MAG TPA: hypothetical protein VJJ82_04405 [Candidatus Nanoarchaeia archaeon]|nr:hypothetical protein [Candidatus Nanoarchaeia archaeon]
MRERTPQDVYEELSAEGAYEEAGCDKDEITKIKTLTLQDYEYGKMLKKLQNPNWRVIFNIHYDALRELCDALIRFKQQKTSNHQGVFAFIILQFPELEFDWKFFEIVRTVRNNNKYRGTDISKETWKNAELQMDFYIKGLTEQIEKRLKE